MIQCRYYNIKGIKLEACFFRKGEIFPDTDDEVSRQGVWARRVGGTWDQRYYLGRGWQQIQLDPDLIYLAEKKS